jgi:Dienelactone hydrolase family
MRHAEETGFPGEVIRRGVQAVEGLPAGLVYAGFSLGVLPAQMLAQTRPGARGALLFYSCVPVSEFGSAWPDGVPVQVHGMDNDPIFAGEGDIDAARELVEQAKDAELFPGIGHGYAARNPDETLGRRPRASVGHGRAAEDPAEAGREGPDAAGADGEAHLGHGPVGHPEQGGRTLEPPGQQVLVRRLAEGPLELPAEVGLRQPRGPGHAGDGQRLGVAGVGQVAGPQQVAR